MITLYLHQCIKSFSSSHTTKSIIVKKCAIEIQQNKCDSAFRTVHEGHKDYKCELRGMDSSITIKAKLERLIFTKHLQLELH